MSDINSYNYVCLIGHVTKEVKFDTIKSESGYIARFNLGTHEKFYNKKKLHQEFHSIVAWGKTAEFCSKWIKKGKMVQIIGKLRTSMWRDEDGNNRKTVQVHAEKVILLGKKDKEKKDEDPF